MCQEFVERLNARAKEKGWTYRLPTSAEWEYACRGGPLPHKEDYGFHYYLDRPTNELAPNKANIKTSKLQRTCKVGSYAANRLGLYDMHGNVFELCEDIAKRGGKALSRLRGGGWLDDAVQCQASNVNLSEPSDNYEGGGLRLARVPSAAAR
jgi:formylglycine-generating enzyme required for sulfatase activity